MLSKDFNQELMTTRVAFTPELIRIGHTIKVYQLIPGVNEFTLDCKGIIKSVDSYRISYIYVDMVGNVDTGHLFADTILVPGKEIIEGNNYFVFEVEE